MIKDPIHSGAGSKVREVTRRARQFRSRSTGRAHDRRMARHAIRRTSRPSGRLAPLVAMVKATDARMRDDRGVADLPHDGLPHRRRVLGEAEVRAIVVVPVVVVVGQEFREQALQMALVEHDHVVEQIAAHGFDPALRPTTQRSATPFCQGLYGVICLRRMPMCSMVSKTTSPYFLSLSKTR